MGLRGLRAGWESPAYPPPRGKCCDTTGSMCILPIPVSPRPVLVNRFTHLGKFTVMTTEPWVCISQSKLHPRASWPIGIAIGIPDSHADEEQKKVTCPHPWADLLGWGRGVQQGGGEEECLPGEEEGADSSIETLTEDRRGDSALSQKLDNTGLTSLADKNWPCQWSIGIV